MCGNRSLKEDNWMETVLEETLYSYFYLFASRHWTYSTSFHIELRIYVQIGRVVLCEQISWRTESSGMLRRVTLVRTDVLEELRAFIIRVTRIGELGALAIISNQGMLWRNTKWERKLVLTPDWGCREEWG
jgi:hypothetical protein